MERNNFNQNPVNLEAPSYNPDRLKELGGEIIKLSVLEEGSGKPELFNTIQGEGRNTGHPTAFLRLSECNLNCNFCDTSFTWAFTEQKAALHEDGKVYDKEQWQVKEDTAGMAEQIYAMNDKSVVITGGEPLMQQPAVISIGNKLKAKDEDYHIEIETAGTIKPREDLVELVDQFNVSPKLTSSSNNTKKSLKYEPLEAFARLDKADFKFVITSEDDIREVLELVNRHEIEPTRVFLMPEGRTRDEIAEHANIVADLCVKYGFNMTNRLHIQLWGNEKNR